ncbi:MAG: hypothetical protein KAT27_00860, partial [Desulfobacterales bacterium]|nr:hypothetical protein [Desulfobacterales bacterium]
MIAFSLTHKANSPILTPPKSEFLSIPILALPKSEFLSIQYQSIPGSSHILTEAMECLKEGRVSTQVEVEKRMEK